MILALATLVTASCGQYNEALQSSDPELKYKLAQEYFEDEKYDKANKLLEQVMQYYRGTPSMERIEYFYAYSFYGMSDYILAAYHLERFLKNYPQSSKAEECAYLTAYCYYLDSPRSSLDQESTERAIAEIQKFINRFPETERMGEMNDLIGELRGKLERKHFEIARLYYKLEDYQAAMVSFGNMLNDYPDTQYREKILYFRLKSSYEYAINSVREKQEQRFIETKTAYRTLIKQFPETEYRKEAERMSSRIEQEMAMITGGDEMNQKVSNN